MKFLQSQTYIDVSLLVAQEQVVHDGSVMEVLQRGHVLHPPDAAVVHRLHLLPGEGVLLVGVHLDQEGGKHGDVNHVKETLRWVETCQSSVCFHLDKSLLFRMNLNQL